jgi:hypothetical protein
VRLNGITPPGPKLHTESHQKRFKVRDTERFTPMISSQQFHNVHRGSHGQGRLTSTAAQKRPASSPGRFYPSWNDPVTTEAFYEFYLTRPLSRTPFKPCHYLLSQRSSGRRATPSGPETHLGLLEHTRSSFASVVSALQTYITVLHTRRLPKDELQRAYRVDRPGAKALQWLFASSSHDRIELVQQPGFLSAAVFCLVAEGSNAEELLWVSRNLCKRVR